MATAAEIQTAYRAIVRADLNPTSAAAVAASGISLDAYIAGLTAQQSSTTGASVAIASFVTGVTPTSAKLDALKVEADKQVASYAAMGVANPALGAFEAFGRSFATDADTTAGFAAKYGSLSTADFVNTVYIQVYGALPGTAAAANLAGQVAYFTKLYTDNAVPNAALAAKGAVLGQIVGYAFTDPVAGGNSTLDNSVATFLAAAAKGDTSGYGKALPATGGTGTPGVTLTLTNGVDTFDPGQTNSASKTSAGDDTIRGLAAGDLKSVDIIDGGAGIDTLNAVIDGAAIAAVLKSVEKVNLTTTAAGEISLATVTGLTDLTTTGGNALTVKSASLDVSYGIVNGAAGTDGLYIVGANVAGTNDTVKLVSTSTAAGTATAGIYQIDGIENASVTLNSDVASDTHAVTLSASGAAGAALKTVTLTGTGVTTLAFNADQLAKVTSVDASAVKGALTLNAAGATLLTNVVGSAGNDTISNAAAGAKIQGGLGADGITLGAGAQTLVYKSGAESTANSFDTVTGFTTASDKIDVSFVTVAAGVTKGIGETVLGQPAGDVTNFFKISGTQYAAAAFDNGGAGISSAWVAVDVNGDGNFTNGVDLLVTFNVATTIANSDLTFGA